MNQVFVCGTFFHVYVSILKTIFKEDKNTKSLLIISDHTPGLASIYTSLSQSGIFDHVLKVPFYEMSKKVKAKSFFARVIGRNKKTIRLVETDSDILKYEEFIKNAEINLFYNGGLISTYFIIKYGNKNFIRMLEDGEGNYFARVGAFKAFKRKYLLNTVIGDGLDPEIKEIQVQLPERLVPKLKGKGKKLELKKMQQELSAAERDRIVKIFMNGVELNITGKKKLLLITQPIEEKDVNEKKKIRIYNDLLKLFANDYSIFVKTHPRELTEYKGKLDYPFTAIPKEFPLEMFDLLTGINFELGVTLFSSALYNINCVEKKIIMGREYLKKPLPTSLEDLAKLQS